jgi:arylformamidase
MKRYYDLSYGFYEDSFHPFGFPSFRNVQSFVSHGCRHAYAEFSLHTATHIDSPRHMIEDGKRLDQVPLQELIGDAVVIDLSSAYGPERTHSAGITLAHILERLEAGNLTVNAGDALLVYTGWARLYRENPSRYYEEYCTLDSEAAHWVAEKGIRLVAIDAPDIDLRDEYLNSPFQASNHKLLLGKGIYIIENLGGEIASGAPVRLIARV